MCVVQIFCVQQCLAITAAMAKVWNKNSKKQQILSDFLPLRHKLDVQTRLLADTG